MIYLFLIASIVVLPLVFLVSTLDPMLPLRTLLLAGIDTVMMGHLLILFRRAKERDNYDSLNRPVFFALGLYVVVCALATLTASNKSEAVVELLKIVLAGIFLTAACVLLNRADRNRELFARMSIITSCTLSVVALCQYYDLGFTFIPGNVIPYATMANKNLLAAFLAISVPIAMFGCLRFHKWWLAISMLSLLLSFFVVIQSQTRSAWVAMAASGVIIAAASPWWLKKLKRISVSTHDYRFRVIAAIVGLAMVFILAASGIADRQGTVGIGDRISSITELGNASIHERLVLWDKSLSLFTLNPWSGVGPGNWKISFPALGTEGTRAERGDLLFQRPHNDYLWVLTESGIFGLLFYLAVFASAGVYCLRVMRRSQSQERFLNAICVFAALLIFMAVSFFSYPRERVALLVLVMLLLANAVSLYNRECPRTRRLPASITAVLLCLGLLGALIGGVVAAKRLAVEIHVARMTAAHSRGNWHQVVQECDAARSMWMTLDATATPLLWYRGVAEFNMGRQSAACDDFEEAYKYNPNHPHVLNNLGTCRELAGDHEQAVVYYQRAAVVAPRFDEAYLNLAAVYFNQGLYQDANNAIRKVDPDCDDPKYQIFLSRIRNKLNPH